jgi:glyoxylase-like metal-dependent hydrolase (beta-lactamase superfamily II)
MPGSLSRVAERIYRVAAPFGVGGLVHCYLIDAPRRTIIDTGTSVVPQESLLPALREAGWDPAEIRYIVNTHMHADHTGGNAEMKSLSDAAIHLHRADAHRVDPTVYLAEQAADEQLLGESRDRAGTELRVLEQLGRDWGVDRVLDEGDVLDLGADIRLQVVHTPGHTPGSACFFWESTSTLFSGDAVGGRGSRPNGYPLYTSAVDYRRSLERLLEMPIRHLAQAHRYRWSGVDLDATRHEGDVERTLRESLAVWETIDAAVAAALAQTPDRPFADVFRDVVERAAPALGNDPTVPGIPSGALPTIAAHWRVQTARPG